MSAREAFTERMVAVSWIPSLPATGVRRYIRPVRKRFETTEVAALDG